MAPKLIRARRPLNRRTVMGDPYGLHTEYWEAFVTGRQKPMVFFLCSPRFNLDFEPATAEQVETAIQHMIRRMNEWRDINHIYPGDMQMAGVPWKVRNT